MPACSSWSSSGGGSDVAREWGSADWERLLAERGHQLMGTAIALSGSRVAGEDLLQAALERGLRKPRQVDRDMEGYLRRGPGNRAGARPRRRRRAGRGRQAGWGAGRGG